MATKALQLHYTSCRRGQRGGMGFQIRCISPGIRPDEQREVESRSGYIPPRDLPSQPTPEEIESDFPIAFRAYRLSSGRFALTRSQYSGRDYSMRWGNFFAHTLIFDGELPSTWPIDYYEWPGWQRALGPEEDTDAPPPALAEIDINSIEPSPSFSLDELQAFLREAPRRVEILETMIRAVFVGNSSSRMLVVRDTPLITLFWLACVQKAFPARHAMNLSLSTYQFDSRDCAKLNGTTKGTNFTFDDTQRKFQFCMFDRAEGRDSEIPHTGDEYARSIAKWMSEQPSQLAEFHTFMAQVDHGVIGEDLLHPLRLFRVRTGDDESLNGEQLVAAVEFTAKRARGEAREALFDLAAQAALWTALSGSGEQLSIVFRFLSEWLDERTSRSTQLAIAETWVRCFENIRLANRWQALSALSQVRAEIARRAPECERAISENILSDEETIKIGTAAASIPNDADMALGSIMTEVLRAAKSRGAAPAWECPAVHSILSACRTRALRKVAGAAALLRSFDGDAGGIAVVCSTLLNTAGDGQLKIGRDAILLGEALLDVIADKPAAVCASVYRALDNSETWGVLFGHWYASLAKHPSRRQLYNEYRDKVLAHAPRFDRVARGNIAHSFAEQLDPKIRAEQAFAWVQSGEIDLFSRETQAWCLETVLPAIRLSRETAASLTAARELAARGRQLGLAFTPDRPWLRELIEQVADARTTIRSLGLEHLPSSLRQLGEADYLEFLRSFLRPALILATNDTEHETCIRGTLLFDQRTTFGETYCAAISASGNALLPTPAVLAALKFWLRTSTGTSIDGLQGFVQPAKDALTARLAAMPREEFEAFQSELAADKDLSPEGCAQWLRIQGQVERHNRTILARLGGVFWRNRTQEKIGK